MTKLFRAASLAREEVLVSATLRRAQSCVSAFGKMNWHNPLLLPFFQLPFPCS